MSQIVYKWIDTFGGVCCWQTFMYAKQPIHQQIKLWHRNKMMAEALRVLDKKLTRENITEKVVFEKRCLSPSVCWSQPVSLFVADRTMKSQTPCFSLPLLAKG